MAERSERGEAQSDPLSEEAAGNTLALNPLVGLTGRDLMESDSLLLKAAVNEPAVFASQWLSFVGELGSIGGGRSDRTQAPGDKRFADGTWESSAPHRGLLQAYLAWGDAINGFIQKTSLGDIDKARAHLIANIMIDAASDEQPVQQSGRSEAVPRYRRRQPPARRQELPFRPCRERRNAGAGRQVAVQGRRQYRRDARRGRFPQ